MPKESEQSLASLLKRTSQLDQTSTRAVLEAVATANPTTLDDLISVWNVALATAASINKSRHTSCFD